MQSLSRMLISRTGGRASMLRHASSRSSHRVAAAPPPRTLGASIPDDDILVKAAVLPSVLKPYVAAELEEDDKFGLHKLVQVHEMFEARLHYGHKVGTLHDNMKWSLFGERLGVCIFDLEVTRQHLIRALDFVAHVVSRGGIILFVSSHRDTAMAVEHAAEEVGQYSHVRMWQEGTFTNMKQLLGATVRLPDTIIFLSALSSLGERHPAIVEAAKMAIPTIGVVDSNADPAYLTYVVPANDDSPQAVNYILRLFKQELD